MQLQKTADIALTIKDRVSAVIEELQRADHAVIEFYMTRTVKNSRIYKTIEDTI